MVLLVYLIISFPGFILYVCVLLLNTYKGKSYEKTLLLPLKLSARIKEKYLSSYDLDLYIREL